MPQKPEPIRIRDASGLPMPVTPAQRAKIITIDLDNPPPFIGVLGDLERAYDIVHKPLPGIAAWVHRPDWGAAANMFDRRQALAPARRNFEIYNSDGDRANEVRSLVAGSLKSPHACLFLDNIHAMCDAVASATNSHSVYAGIDFEPKPVPCDVHIDVWDLRMLISLEHGSVVLPDMAAAQAAGFTFSTREDAARNPWELIDLIEADVPVYAAALGDATFLRGQGLCNDPTWHAAYEMDRTAGFQRPNIKADFSFINLRR